MPIPRILRKALLFFLLKAKKMPILQCSIGGISLISKTRVMCGCRWKLMAIQWLFNGKVKGNSAYPEGKAYCFKSFSWSGFYRQPKTFSRECQPLAHLRRFLGQMAGVKTPAWAMPRMGAHSNRRPLIRCRYASTGETQYPHRIKRWQAAIYKLHQGRTIFPYDFVVNFPLASDDWW